MSLYRDEAVVLRTWKLGEADRIVNLHTLAHGKVRAVARGVRRTRSKFGARLEPACHVAVQLYRGRSELHTLTQAETIDRFASLPESTDTTTSDVPPWPKHGPGEGIDDDSPRDEEGTGRNAGEPGTGFAILPPGSIADRIDTEQAPEVELAGLRQDGAHRSFLADSAGQVARGQARRPMQDMRARFTRRAEQTLNEEWIPLDARNQIKRYFQAIQTRR